MIGQRSILITVRDNLVRRVLEQGLTMDGWIVNDKNGSILQISDNIAVKSGSAVITLPPGKIRLGEMLVRARHASDNAGRAISGVLVFAHFTLDLAGLVLTDGRDGRKIILTEKERDILVRLDQADGASLDRKTLLADIWSYAETVETHTLETHIYRLRQKVEDDPADPQIIITNENGYFLGDGV
jgi:DNA-binding response OmpR family regulator